MVRDITQYERYLDDKENSDIIYKKDELYKLFKEDPDLQEVLGSLDNRPLNTFEDEENPTDEELKLRQEILDYNKRIKHDQIVPFLKLNGIQSEVLNFIMYDIRDIPDVMNPYLKKQELWIMCLVHEDDTESQYATEDGMTIPRVDLLSYIIKDLLCWTNALGLHLELKYDVPEIVDKRYYCRTLKFEASAPNNLQGGGNKYDRFTRI